MTGMLGPVPLPHPALFDPNGRLCAGFNRRHFFFRHGLAAHPLFALDSLGALTRRIPDPAESVHWSNGPVEVDDDWHQGARQLSLRHTMARIEHNDSLIILRQVQRDATFAPLLRGLLSTLIMRCGKRLADDIVSAEASILIASPGRITPVHLDAEPHFMLQVLGEQDLGIFDADDRSLVSEPDLERYHAADEGSVQCARSRQAEAGAYYQHADRGVHIPAHAPHWARSRNNVSVALRLSFGLRSMIRSGRVRRINHWLRRQGMRPTPPGIHRWVDQLKLAPEDTINAMRSLARRGCAVVPLRPLQVLPDISDGPVQGAR